MAVARIVSTALTACVLLGAWGPAHGQVIERVLAVVDGRVITLLDVEAVRIFGLVEVPADGDPVPATLSALIDRTLILDEVDRYAPPEPDTATIERGLARVRSRFASQASFDTALERTGMELFALRQWVRNDLRIQAYLEQRFAAVSQPVGDELEEHIRREAAALREQDPWRSPEELAQVARERVTRERRDALVSDWVKALRARARISLPASE